MMIEVTAETQADPARQIWICDVCEFVYDPAEGDPDGGIPGGTAFSSIPDDWICPVCGARKKEFRLMKPGDPVPAEATW